MKKLLLIFMMASTISAAFAQKPDKNGFIVKIGDKAPKNITLTLTNGKTVSLSSLKGKVILLQFTASWCGVCREETPHLEKEAWQAFKDKGLVMFGVDRNEPLETVKKFEAEMNTSYPMALDPGAQIFSKFAIKKSGVTRNILINKEGTIVYMTRLYDKAEFAGLIAKLNELFK